MNEFTDRIISNCEFYIMVSFGSFECIKCKHGYQEIVGIS